jgi:hypothetical protein
MKKYLALLTLMFSVCGNSLVFANYNKINNMSRSNYNVLSDTDLEDDGFEFKVIVLGRTANRESGFVAEDFVANNEEITYNKGTRTNKGSDFTDGLSNRNSNSSNSISRHLNNTSRRLSDENINRRNAINMNDDYANLNKEGYDLDYSNRNSNKNSLNRTGSYDDSNRTTMRTRAKRALGNDIYDDYSNKNSLNRTDSYDDSNRTGTRAKRALGNDIYDDYSNKNSLNRTTAYNNYNSSKTKINKASNDRYDSSYNHLNKNRLSNLDSRNVFNDSYNLTTDDNLKSISYDNDMELETKINRYEVEDPSSENPNKVSSRGINLETKDEKPSEVQRYSSRGINKKQKTSNSTLSNSYDSDSTVTNRKRDISSNNQNIPLTNYHEDPSIAL